MAITDGINESVYLLKEKTKAIKSLIESNEEATLLINQLIFGMDILMELTAYGIINQIHLVTEEKEEV